MVCKIKFNNPLLDSPERYPMTTENHDNLFSKKLDALFQYYTNGQEGLPDNLPLSAKYVITELADLAEIPGLMHNPKTPGQPSRWNDEDGFILSARVQIYLLRHPSTHVRKAVIKIARKLFPELSDDGIYHRYVEELNKEHSCVSIAKHRIDHLKEINNYDNLHADQQEEIINIFKARIADTFSQIFPNSTKSIFNNIPEVKQITRIDLNKIFPEN